MIHPLEPRRRGAWTARTALLLAALPLAACSGDAGLRTLAVEAGYGPKAVRAPDFVANSRPQGAQDYLPVGASAPPRALGAKSAEGQKALEAELEGARSRNEARGRAATGAGRAAGRASAPAAD